MSTNIRYTFLLQMDGNREHCPPSLKIKFIITVIYNKVNIQNITILLQLRKNAIFLYYLE